MGRSCSEQAAPTLVMVRKPSLVSAFDAIRFELPDKLAAWQPGAGRGEVAGWCTGGPPSARTPETAPKATMTMARATADTLRAIRRRARCSRPAGTSKAGG